MGIAELLQDNHSRCQNPRRLQHSASVEELNARLSACGLREPRTERPSPQSGRQCTQRQCSGTTYEGPDGSLAAGLQEAARSSFRMVRDRRDGQGAIGIAKRERPQRSSRGRPEPLVPGVSFFRRAIRRQRPATRQKHRSSMNRAPRQARERNTRFALRRLLPCARR